MRRPDAAPEAPPDALIQPRLDTERPALPAPMRKPEQIPLPAEVPERTEMPAYKPKWLPVPEPDVLKLP